MRVSSRGTNGVGVRGVQPRGVVSEPRWRGGHRRGEEGIVEERRVLTLCLSLPGLVRWEE